SGASVAVESSSGFTELVPSNPIAGFQQIQNGLPSGLEADNVKTYQTYTKTHPETGKVYTGRTSGTGSPEENVRSRDVSHHMNDQGFAPAVIDKSSPNADAIRGREQQLIDANGAAQSRGGTSGNAIN